MRVLTNTYVPGTRRLVAHARTHVQRMARFAIVGTCGVAVNTVTLFLLVNMGHLNKLIAAAIATEVTIVTNFIMNDVWTFRGVHSRLSWPERLLRYNAVALGGMLITLAVLAMLTLWVGLHYLVANLIAIATATIWNYVVNFRLTWRVHLHAMNIVTTMRDLSGTQSATHYGDAQRVRGGG
ncbi:MAG: hypothetical protein JWO59_2110 [Chloroflexi bacterium]|nr:hypothetical protein [Chloroflexota bacterium]